MPAPHRSHPAYALCAYAAPLVASRRVVLVGDASLELGELLVDAGARVVHVYDPNAERAKAHAQAGRGVTVLPLPREGFEVRDGAFDVAIVPDLTVVSDPPALLGRLRRLLAKDGALLVAAKNPATARGGAGAIEYADLYDMVALQFASVRMIGLVPFSGVTLAELGESEDEPEVSVDTQLGPEDRTPQLFVALAAQHDVRLAPYALVELPAQPAGLPPAVDDAAHRAALAEATLRADLLAAQLDQARAAAQRAAAESDGVGARRIAELEARAQLGERRVAEAEARALAADARAADHLTRAERLTHEVRALEGEVQRLRTRAVELDEQVTDYKRMRAHAEVELTAARAGLSEYEDRLAALSSEVEAARDAAEVPQVDPDAIAALAERAARGEKAEAIIGKLQGELEHLGAHHAQELGQVESLLRERARAIQELEGEVVRRERLVRELVRALEEVQQAGAMQAGTMEATAVAGGADGTALEEARRETAALRKRLDAMALDLARREGDAQSHAWRVAELEERLTMAKRGASAGVDPEADRRVAQVQVELDALRQALAQEHDARARAESGEALTKAQAELARQATLIEQLSRELDARERGRRAEA